MPTEHIQLAMVIKKDGLKQATVKLSYLRGVAVEPLVDILGCTSVKHKVSNNPKCEMQKAVDRQGHSKRPSMTSTPERQ